MQLPVKRYEWALSRLKKAGLRPTHSRHLILQVLANHKIPVSLDVLGEELRGTCDLTTIYRTMLSLRRIGIVRQVNLITRPTFFVLAAPGEHCEYLVCNHCGTIIELPHIKSIFDLQKRIADRSGFHKLRHEAVFYGICSDCQPDQTGNGEKINFG